MASPARAADEPEVPAPGRDPAEPRWAEVLTTEIMAMRRAVDDLARDPGDGRALETAILNVKIAVRLGEFARRVTFDEEALAAEYARGYEDGAAAGRAARRRLAPVPDCGG